MIKTKRTYENVMRKRCIIALLSENYTGNEIACILNLKAGNVSYHKKGHKDSIKYDKTYKRMFEDIKIKFNISDYKQK
jgi:hypothetical protein